MDYEASITTYQENTLLFNESTICHIEDNVLEYSTDADTIRINLDKFKFIKENLESILKISENKCTLKLKELNKVFEIPIDFVNYEWNENKKFILEYKLESQEKPLKIVIEIEETENEI